MEIPIVTRHNPLEDERPTPEQLLDGELALCINETGCSLACKDSDGNIHQVSPVKISETEPSNPLKQGGWFQISTRTLFFYDGNAWIEAGSGGDNVQKILKGDGIGVSPAEGTGIVTLTVNVDSEKGLQILADKIAVAVGDGLRFDANGKLAIAEDLNVSSITATGQVQAGTFKGDGSELINLPPVAANTLQEVTDAGSSTTNTIEVAGLTSTGPVTAQKFVGDGSELINLPPVAANTLQEVTTAGSSTTDAISVAGVTSAGLVESQANGFKFPDGTTQTTAAVRDVGNLQEVTDKGHSTTNTLEVAGLTSTGSATFAGSVSIGGTAAANTVDVYEEGTFTPTLVFSTSGSVTYGYQEGFYTLIGNIVRVNLSISTNGISAPTGEVSISGLPAAISIGTDGFYPLHFGEGKIANSVLGVSNNLIKVIASGDESTNSLLTYKDAAYSTKLQGTDFLVGGNKNQIKLSIIYQTD